MTDDGLPHLRTTGWRPGQRVVFVNGDTVFPGTLTRRDDVESARQDEDFWFIEWDSGEQFDYSFSQYDLLLLDKERAS